MYLRRRLIQLTIVSSFLLAPLAGTSQTARARGGTYAPCVVRIVDRPCPNDRPLPYPTPLPPSIESMERELRLAQLQSASAARHRSFKAAEAPQQEPAAHADPDAPDQSELLKNSKDADFIRRTFKTMYVVTKDIDFFDAQQMKAALRRNPDFQKLNIEIVDDRRVADTVLIVTYTFAWDYPFELRHQNTTTVLFAGKGEGPFSGPLGAADVAREFVELAKPWRTSKEPKK